MLEEFQALGYPILSMRSIPKTREYLDPVFAEDLRKGLVDHPMDVSDVWPENYSVNSVQKVWAAKFASRHPHVAVLDLSSFKCGHDAPIYTVIEEVVENSGTPYFSFKDVDENKPTGSIKIRIQTIGYFLKRYQEDLRRDLAKRERVKERLAEYQAELLQRIESAQAKFAAEKVFGKS